MADATRKTVLRHRPLGVLLLGFSPLGLLLPGLSPLGLSPLGLSPPSGRGSSGRESLGRGSSGRESLGRGSSGRKSLGRGFLGRRLQSSLFGNGLGRARAPPYLAHARKGGERLERLGNLKREEERLVYIK